jgi:hypothetical protein
MFKAAGPLGPESHLISLVVGGWLLVAGAQEK